MDDHSCLPDSSVQAAFLHACFRNEQCSLFLTYFLKNIFTGFADGALPIFRKVIELDLLLPLLIQPLAGSASPYIKVLPIPFSAPDLPAFFGPFFEPGRIITGKYGLVPRILHGDFYGHVAFFYGIAPFEIVFCIKTGCLTCKVKDIP